MESTLTASILNFLSMAGLAVVIAAIGYVISELVLIRLIKVLLSRFIESTWIDFLTGIVRLGLFLLTGKIIIDLTGTAGALVVIVTAVTGAFAIGSERLASDVVSGVKLMFLRYYRIGEYVTLGEYFGKVTEINMNSTSLVTIDKEKIIIPNAEAIETTLINHSRIPGYRVKVRIPIQGEHDRGQVIGILEETAANFDARLTDEGFDPIILYSGIGAGTDYYEVWIYVERWPDTVYKSSDLRLQLVEALSAKGISVGVAPVFAFEEGVEV
ncbi:MAG: mechanosensitive ion channel [Anaerolineales bacterium]|nr:mechanosensitive ion channel [Chloroflexota bacterium]MBL6983719.1 mechanosensitive ion channel [Anaerolineales bacterium]